MAVQSHVLHSVFECCTAALITSTRLVARLLLWRALEHIRCFELPENMFSEEELQEFLCRNLHLTEIAPCTYEDVSFMCLTLVSEDRTVPMTLDHKSVRVHRAINIVSGPQTCPGSRSNDWDVGVFHLDRRAAVQGHSAATAVQDYSLKGDLSYSITVQNVQFIYLLLRLSSARNYVIH